MRQVRSLLFGLMMGVFLIGCTAGDELAEQQISGIVDGDGVVVLPLYIAPGRATAGVAVVLQQDNLIRVFVTADTRYYVFRDVRACLRPVGISGPCVTWIEPINVDPNRYCHVFILDPDQMIPQMCAVRHRVFLRYRTVRR